jgi:hypothetical protein
MRSCRLALCSALLGACLLILSFPPLISADSGIIPIASTLAYEPGQKAIIGWNGEYEVLILSTDVRADDDTTALQVLPLPSEPDSIEQGTSDSFLRIGELIRHQYEHRGSWLDCAAGHEAGKGVGVDIVFHEKIGAHDIWVAKATDAAEFVQWAEDFLARNEIQHQMYSPELESLVGEYIDEGIEFFVFDLIELTPDQRSVEPIVYRFRSDTLYYPLKISSIVSGATEITLLLVTHERLADFTQLPKSEFEGREYGLAVATTSVGTSDERQPIQFKLGKGKLESIDHRLAKLLGGHAWLTAAVSAFDIDEYGFSWRNRASGIPTAYLDKDVKITKAAFVEDIGDEPSGGGLPVWAWVLAGIGEAMLAFIVGMFIYRELGGHRHRSPTRGR